MWFLSREEVEALADRVAERHLEQLASLIADELERRGIVAAGPSAPHQAAALTPPSPRLPGAG